MSSQPIHHRPNQSTTYSASGRRPVMQGAPQFHLHTSSLSNPFATPPPPLRQCNALAPHHLQSWWLMHCPETHRRTPLLASTWLHPARSASPTQTCRATRSCCSRCCCCLKSTRRPCPRHQHWTLGSGWTHTSSRCVYCCRLQDFGIRRVQVVW